MGPVGWQHVVANKMCFGCHVAEIGLGDGTGWVDLQQASEVKYQHIGMSMMMMSVDETSRVHFGKLSELI